MNLIIFGGMRTGMVINWAWGVVTQQTECQQGSLTQARLQDRAMEYHEH